MISTIFWQLVMGNISLARSHINHEGMAGDRLLEAEKACLRAKGSDTTAFNVFKRWRAG